MDHSKMDHSAHMGGVGHASQLVSNSGMDMPDMPHDMCSMNMLFTWDYKNMCVIFRWWHVRTLTDLVLTMIAIAALSAGYEYVRYRMRGLDAANETSLSNDDQKVRRAIGYALLVAYSYFLMLVFMTYNGWAMLSVAVGAGLGFYKWGTTSARTLACH